MKKLISKLLILAFILAIPLTVCGDQWAFPPYNAASVGLGNVANVLQVQLQAGTPGSAQTGNSNISGKAIAGSVSTGTIVTAAANTLTLTVHTSSVNTVVNNAAVTGNSQVFLFPTNLAATAVTLLPYISAKSAGTSFTVTAVGALGSETYNYLIVN